MESLLLGQIGDPTQGLPAGAGAGLWWLSDDSFGQQATSTGGAASGLVIETDDVDLGGTVLVRRLRLPFAYEGTATVRVSMTLDHDRPVAAQTVVLPAVTEPVERAALFKLFKRCRMLRLRIEVLSATDRVALLGRIGLSFKPIGQATALAAGEVTA